MLGIFLWCGGTFATHHLCLLEIDHCYTAVKIEFPLGGERWEKESVAQHFVYVLRRFSVYKQFILAEYFFSRYTFFSKQMKIESLYSQCLKVTQKSLIFQYIQVYFYILVIFQHRANTWRQFVFRKEACFKSPIEILA